MVIISNSSPVEFPQKLDSGVLGIIFCDTSSVKKILGDSLNFIEEEYISVRHVNYVNEDTTELLILTQYPASYEYDFHLVQIKYFDKSLKEYYKVLNNVKKIITNKGINLGITKKELTNILGDDKTEEVKGDTTILEYKFNEINSKNNREDFLRKCNLPIYYGRYKFFENKLMYIEFGFEIP